MRLASFERSKLRASLIGSLCLLSAACQQTSGDGQNIELFGGGDSLFGSYAADLEDLVKTEDFDRASQLYRDRREYFSDGAERRTRAVRYFA